MYCTVFVNEKEFVVEKEALLSSTYFRKILQNKPETGIFKLTTSEPILVEAVIHCLQDSDFMGKLSMTMDYFGVENDRTVCKLQDCFKFTNNCDYCPEHKCESCNKNKVNDLYCGDHLCLICGGWKDSKRKYCSRHSCESVGCVKVVMRGRACTEHVCKVKGCGDVRLGDYCVLHKCAKCKELSTKGIHCKKCSGWKFGFSI